MKYLSARRRIKFLSLLILLFHPTVTTAAPCCGGGGVGTAMITGDAKAQATLNYLFSYVVGDVGSNGEVIFRSSDNFESRQNWIAEGAFLISDRWQLMARLPIVYQRHETPDSTEESTGFGDAALGVGYEVLPEWSYSKFRPRGYLFFQTIFPLGNSVYESSSGMATNAFSRGFYSFSFGATFLKSWGSWDASTTFEGHQPLSRTFSSPDNGGSIEVDPGFGGSVALASGYTFQDLGLRLGLTVVLLAEDSVSLPGLGIHDSDPQFTWNTSFQVSYPFLEHYSASIIYTDQTLLGPAHNTTLSRFVGASLQYSWDR